MNSLFNPVTLDVFFNKIHRNFRYVFYYLLKSISGDKYIFIKAPVIIRHGKVIHFNWGDELNAHIISYLTNKKAVLLPPCRADSYFPINSYMLIGSILTFYNLDRSIIWGAGIINHNEIGFIRGFPDRIYAVRGPKTRQELEKKVSHVRKHMVILLFCCPESISLLSKKNVMLWA